MYDTTKSTLGPKSNVKRRSCSSPVRECPTERNVSHSPALRRPETDHCSVLTSKTASSRRRACPMLLDSSFRSAKLSKPCACARGETRQQGVIDPGRMYSPRLRVILSSLSLSSQRKMLPSVHLETKTDLKSRWSPWLAPPRAVIAEIGNYIVPASALSQSKSTSFGVDIS